MFVRGYPQGFQCGGCVSFNLPAHSEDNCVQVHVQTPILQSLKHASVLLSGSFGCVLLLAAVPAVFELHEVHLFGCFALAWLAYDQVGHAVGPL